MVSITDPGGCYILFVTEHPFFPNLFYLRSRLLHPGVRGALVSKVAIAPRSPESSSVKNAVMILTFLPVLAVIFLFVWIY